MALPETEQLSRMIASAALSRALCTLGELGVADHIPAGTSQPVAKLAQATGAHEQSLYRMLRFMASHGVFRESSPRQFEHTPLSTVLRTDVEGSFRAATRMFHRIYAGWAGLDHSVRTGESSFESVYGDSLFGFVGKNPELAPIFDAGMTAFHGYETAAMIEAYDFTGINTLADVGGGIGSLLAAVLQKYPQMQGILYELGHVAGRARDLLRSQSVDNRCRVIEGDFFTSIPAGADAYLMRHIIHDWTDEQSVQILKNCRKVMPANGRLLLVEFNVPSGNEPALGKDADMIMMGFPGGMERTNEEYAALFEASGFRLSLVTPTKSAVCVVEGRPVG